MSNTPIVPACESTGYLAETAEQYLKKVKDEVAKFGIQIDDCEFDRAHRVGYTTDRERNPVKERRTIVKFTTFRAKSLVYRKRSKEGDGVRYNIDQTKNRFNPRKLAVEYVKTKWDVDFVFVDINCRLYMGFKNGQFKYFNPEDELHNLVG